MELERFINKITEFQKLSPSAKIDYFIYYLTVIEHKTGDGVTSKDIESCFEKLRITKYSNIGQYLRTNSKRTNGKAPKFVCHNSLYHLERTRKFEIDQELNVPRPLTPSDNYFPLELFNNTRGYLEKIAAQAAACYDHGLYDACSVMTRKLLEVLIIEAFERHQVSNKIKGSSDNFFYLSDLIDKFREEPTWNIGRNAKESLPRLKRLGDLSAHNRRYIATKGDIDKVKDDLRIVLEELLHIIDYRNWK